MPVAQKYASFRKLPREFLLISFEARQEYNAKILLSDILCVTRKLKDPNLITNKLADATYTFQLDYDLCLSVRKQ